MLDNNHLIVSDDTLSPDFPMAWSTPQYSVQDVNASGKAIALHPPYDPFWESKWDALFRHLEIINNWRAAHQYPLNAIQNNLRQSAKRFDDSPLVAQRIKRLVSIRNKLALRTSMKLSQMQDIGGCRAVLRNVDMVRKLVSYYLDQSRMKHVRATMDNYIECPQKSGYRGIHLVYRYVSEKNQAYNNLKIEMQIRSRYQHAWATAVETVGTFVGQALKTSIGDTQWLRFFALMGNAIAIRERTKTVPGTTDNKESLVAELKELSKSLDIANRLSGYASALRYVNDDVENAHWYLLELSPKKNELRVTGFTLYERDKAERRYAEVEKAITPDNDAVLVSVESASALSRAYPNYFADTQVFLTLVDQAISGNTKRIGVPKLLGVQSHFDFGSK